jgi:hypothetical protein
MTLSRSSRQPKSMQPGTCTGNVYRILSRSKVWIRRSWRDLLRTLISGWPFLWRASPRQVRPTPQPFPSPLISRKKSGNQLTGTMRNSCHPLFWAFVYWCFKMSSLTFSVATTWYFKNLWFSGGPTTVWAALRPLAWGWAQNFSLQRSSRWARDTLQPSEAN